jgi:hypothetical protein
MTDGHGDRARRAACLVGGMLLVVTWVACGARTPLDGPPLGTASDPDADVSVLDASARDTGPFDGGAIDASLRDAGFDDAAPPDACAVGCSPLPAAPRPIAPLSTAKVTSHTPRLRWSLAPGTEGAAVDICGDRACTTILQTFRAQGASAAPASALSPGVYYWRLRGTVGSIVGTDTSPVWELFVGVEDASVDTSWTTALDVDGDGYADTAVSLRTASVQIFLGGPQGPAQTATTMPNPSTIFTEGAIAVAGDVDGDGFGDFIVAAGNGANLFFGGPSFATTTPVFIPSGTQYQTVRSIAGAGDVNGDGYADVVMSDPMYTGGLPSTPPAAHLHYGGPVGLSTTPVLIAYAGWDFAWSVAGAGDVNGDGYGDIVTQANPGLFVYYGGPNGPGNPTIFTTMAGENAVAGCMDVNGDGYADIASGQPGADARLQGIVDVHLGGPNGPSANAITVTGTGPGLEGVGSAVASAGDTNGDGYDDMVVSGWLSSSYPGPTFLFFGNANGLGAMPETFYEWNEPVLSGGGDANGDGFADIAATDVGTQVLLYFGSASGPPNTASTARSNYDVLGAAL